VELTKGANAELPAGPVEVVVCWEPVTASGQRVSLDVCALRLGADGRVREDTDLVFFNAPATPDGAVRHLGPVPDGFGEVIAVDAAAQPAGVHSVLITATVDVATPDLTFGGLPVRATVRHATGGATVASFTPPRLTTERALVVVEVYRRGGGWKVRAVGQGYAAGLAGLATDYGVDVEPAPPASGNAGGATPSTPSAPWPSAGSAQSALSPASTFSGTAPGGLLPVDMRTRLDLRKRSVGAVLEKAGLGGQRARVGLALDASGSMWRLYRQGTVARVVERLAAVAARLDDDGAMDAWVYATNPVALPPLTVEAMARWIPLYVRAKSPATGSGGAAATKERERAARVAGVAIPDWPRIGGQNDEPKVMRLVLAHYAGYRSPPPALVIVLTDGGIYRSPQIAQILRESSRLPVFWQFVGVGRASYGVLETLDTLAGRLVDNAGFFAVDDLDGVADQTLYTRLLGEFPGWLRAARAAGVQV
jgi:stress response protein SCP2